LAADHRDSNSQPPPADGSSGFLRQLGNAMDLPFVLVGAVIVGAGIGYFLDKHFATSPLFTLILGGAGFAAGIYEVIRRLTGKRAS
jgi:F0F1-type ATP synthase assembly protein I